jgi:hypothetical protein
MVSASAWVSARDSSKFRVMVRAIIMVLLQFGLGLGLEIGLRLRLVVGLRLGQCYS